MLFPSTVNHAVEENLSSKEAPSLKEEDKVSLSVVQEIFLRGSFLQSSITCLLNVISKWEKKYRENQQADALYPGQAVHSQIGQH